MSLQNCTEPWHWLCHQDLLQMESVFILQDTQIHFNIQLLLAAHHAPNGLDSPTSALCRTCLVSWHKLVCSSIWASHCWTLSSTALFTVTTRASVSRAARVQASVTIPWSLAGGGGKRGRKVLNTEQQQQPSVWKVWTHHFPYRKCEHIWVNKFFFLLQCACITVLEATTMGIKTGYAQMKWMLQREGWVHKNRMCSDEVNVTEGRLCA